MNSNAQAGGLFVSAFGQPNQGASNAGAGALAEDASTAFQNPAGIMFLEDSKWMVTGLVIGSSIKFKQDEANTNVPDGDGNLPGSNGGDAGGVMVGGALFYARPVSDKWGFGFSLTSISGAIMDYEHPDDFVGRYWATEVELLTINATPSISLRVTEDLSVGLAVPVMFGSLNMDVAIPGINCGPILGCNEGTAQIKDGDDISASLGISFLWQATDSTRFGAAYLGEQDLKFSSDLEITLPTGVQPGAVAADVEIVFPQMVRSWVAHDLNDNVTLLGSLAWEDWSALSNVPISTPSGGGALPRNWEDTWHLGLGVRWHNNGPWTFYTGVGYDTDPTKASDRTADMPIDEQWRLSGGTTYEFSGGSKLGVSVTLADYGDAEIANGGERPGPLPNPWTVTGEYTTNRVIFLGLNYGW